MVSRPAVVPAERVLDEEGTLVESAQAERAEVDVPFAVVDLDDSTMALVRLPVGLLPTSSPRLSYGPPYNLRCLPPHEGI